MNIRSYNPIVGDKVKIKPSDCSDSFEGYIGEIDSLAFYVWQDEKDGAKGYFYPSTRGFKYSWYVRKADDGTVEVLSSKKNIMTNVLEKFKVSLLPEPEKTFRKLGLIDGDNMLTNDGTTLMMNFLLNKHKKEFNDEVVSKLVDEKEEK